MKWRIQKFAQNFIPKALNYISTGVILDLYIGLIDRDENNLVPRLDDFKAIVPIEIK